MANAGNQIKHIIPISLQNGHKNSNRVINKKARSLELECSTKTKLTKGGTVPGEVAAFCSMCGQREPHSLVDLSGNVVMKKSLTSYLEMPQEKLESTLRSLCVKCVYKINTRKELMKRSFQIHLEHLSNGDDDTEANCKLYKIKASTSQKTTRAAPKNRQRAQLPRKARRSSSCGIGGSESSSPASFTTITSPKTPPALPAPLTEMRVPAAINEILIDFSVPLAPKPMSTADVSMLDNISTNALPLKALEPTIKDTTNADTTLSSMNLSLSSSKHKSSFNPKPDTELNGSTKKQRTKEASAKEALHEQSSPRTEIDLDKNQSFNFENSHKSEVSFDVNAKSKIDISARNVQRSKKKRKRLSDGNTRSRKKKKSKQVLHKDIILKSHNGVGEENRSNAIVSATAHCQVSSIANEQKPELQLNTLDCLSTNIRNNYSKESIDEKVKQEDCNKLSNQKLDIISIANNNASAVKRNGLHNRKHRKRKIVDKTKNPKRLPNSNTGKYQQSEENCLSTKEQFAISSENKICEELHKSSLTSLLSIEANDDAAAVPSSKFISSKPSLANSSAKCLSTDSHNSKEESRNNSMLVVLNESNAELAFNTESGQTAYNKQHKASKLFCKYCGRSYVRKKMYTKHVRRCPVRYSKKADTNQPEDSAESIVPRPKRMYYCGECDETSDNLVKLREHERSHLVHRYCELCNESFAALHEYEFHCVQCDAKHEALNELATAEEDDYEMHSSMRVTRARSRLASFCLSRSASRISLNNSRYFNDKESYDDVTEDDDDEVSIADTMYTKRMRYTGDWVVGNSNSNSCQSLYGERLYNYVEEQPLTDKEYDLYLLDRLKYEKQMNTFTCFVPGCRYVTDTLLEIMIHDYKYHFKYSWFYCKKCARVFTSKVFLDYHLDRQDGGRFICYKCGDIFEFQHQLDRHLVCHTKRVNYHCNYCKFEFLSESELLQHCEIDGHDPNGERKLIHIEPAMTITNPVPPAPKIRRDIYIIHDLVMNLPAISTKRPMELPKYEFHQRRIGDVEFKNQKNPNCWGWK